MNADLTKAAAVLTTGSYCTELRKRVERLEFLRGDACSRRDRKCVRIIDMQIKLAVTEWLNTYVFGFDARLAETA